MEFIRVTTPSEGCPRGTIIEVYHIQDDGTVYGMNVGNDNDWTRYCIPKGEYEFIEYKGVN